MGKKKSEIIERDISLFNRTLINQEMEYFDLQYVPDWTKKLSIISNWNAKDLKNFTETQIESDFYTDIFNIVLDYKKPLGPSEIFNIIPKMKVSYGSDFPDASLGNFTTDTLKDQAQIAKRVKAIIELKSPGVNLDKKQNRIGLNLTPVEQAFKASSKFESCKWIIVSNYNEIRLYSHDTELKYEKFNINNLQKENILKKFYFLLCYGNLIPTNGNSIVDDIYKRNQDNPIDITHEFYEKYKILRINLLNHLLEENRSYVKENEEVSEYILLEKTQKIIDRVVFIAFCRDHGLLPFNVFDSVFSVYSNLWSAMKGLFNSVNLGFVNKITGSKINKFNGGLFAEDEILDKKLHISDELMKDISDLVNYNFKSQLNINILGKMFEQSISDIEEIKNALEIEDSKEMDDKISGLSQREQNIKKKMERQAKKEIYEGIVYTPPYITNFITETAISRWIELQKIEVKRELGLDIEDNNEEDMNIDFYRKLLYRFTKIKIIDPACGSGAFLIQAFDILVKWGEYFNKKLLDLTKLKDKKIKNAHGQTTLLGFLNQWKKDILKNNLYGVDKNAESVEITKLSLWLKTANKKEPLTFLDENIRQGNSIIDDDKFSKNAFKWNNFQDGKFDIVIGNPPWEVISEKESGLPNLNELKKYFKHHDILKNAMCGKSNLFKLFIIRAANLLHEKGIFSFIVPMVLLADKQSSKIRHYLFKHFIFNFFEVFPQKDDINNRVFKKAKTATCIFQLERNRDIYSHDIQFWLRIHSGKEISTPMKQANWITFNDIKKYDGDSYSIPISYPKDWEYMQKILHSKRLINLKEMGIELYQGEVNETNMNNHGDKNPLSLSDTGYEVLRGSSISRYAVRLPSQGDRKWINPVQYLSLMGESAKSNNYRYKRIGFQESSPQNNFRRLIAAPINKNVFCFHTINYVTENSCPIGLNFLLLLLNSEILDWYFQKMSSNNHVSHYQVYRLPIPVFNETDEEIPSEILKMYNSDDFIGIEAKIVNIRKRDIIYPLWIKKILLKLCNNILEIEGKRDSNLTKRERAHLDSESQRFQIILDDILFVLYDIDSNGKNYIRNKLSQNLL